jgi:regulator of protease activity HflC (stomatin/prohibitin superfamily)
MAWIIFLVVALPIIGLLLWLFLDEAFQRIEPGNMGIVLVRGRATDKVLLPGRHFVPVLRSVQIVDYPSLELSYRAGEDTQPAPETRLERRDQPDLEYGGPPLHVILGDRATLELLYTVRFRLIPTQLRTIHERFGPRGLWSAVRDTSAKSLRASLSDPAVSLDNLFGTARSELEGALSTAMAAALAEDGFEMTLFNLGDLDLGRTGEVIQATVRARLELAREEAERGTRLAEVETDVGLHSHLAAATDVALRYREIGVWRELAKSPNAAAMLPPTPAHASAPTTAEPAVIAEPAEPRPPADET